jgi:hypothetical protein
MRNTVQKKIDTMKSDPACPFTITLSDASEACEEMFESKVCKLV